ncbi:MAG: serine/threonine-protein kinase [Planctomycetota bacterium]|nr:serine/threonine-protein kinase [Planctomycetota bacterium]
MDETLPPKKPVWLASTTHATVRPAGESPSDATPEWIGPYQVVKKIGSGSMGDVYQCHDQTLGRKVAVKVLKSQFAADEHYRRRFRREARAVASLSHPCVVQVFSIHEEVSNPQDSAYIVMEFVDGCSADDYLAENGPVPVDLAAAWIRDAASGLREAAAKSIIHRDVKPSNILVTPAGRAKIVDFGLAKALGAKNSLTQEGIVLGTPHYISPEQGRGRTLDHRADIYSLGATFYHLITGRPPFDGDSQISVIVAHVNESPVAPHIERPEISESVTRVVFRMMAKTPDDRYASYDDLIEDVEALQAGREPPHTSGSVDQWTPAPPVASGPRLKLVIPLVVALLVGGIALAPALQRDGQPPDLRGQLGTWCVFQDGYQVKLDLDFGNLPGNDPLRLLQSVLTLPPGLPAGAERPDLRNNTLAWSQFSAPFAFAFSFERLDEAELWIADTQEDFDFAFSLVSPHGAQNRQFIFRLSPRQRKEQPLLLAFERNQEVKPIETSLVLLVESRSLRVQKNPVLGAGPFRLKFQLTPLGKTTRIVVTMEKFPRVNDTARSYRLTAVLPGDHWARGVPTLTTESTSPFSLALDRAVFRGELAEEFTVTEVPWRR